MVADTQFFRRLSVEEVYSRTIAVFLKHYGFFLLIGAFYYIVTVLILGPTVFAAVATIMGAVDAAASSPESNSELRPEDIAKLSFFFFAVLFMEMILLMVVHVIVNAAMARGVAEIYIGKTPHVRESLQRGRRVYCILLGAGLIYAFTIMLCYLVFVAVFALVAQVLNPPVALMIMIGFVLILGFIFAGCFLSIFPTLFTSTGVIEKKGPISIIQRSFELARGNHCFIFATSVIFPIVCVIFGSFISSFSRALLGTVVGAFIGFIISTLTNLLSVPLGVIIHTLVYLNIRIEREGLNADVLARELDGVSQSPSESPLPGLSSPGYVAVSLDPSDISDAPLQVGSDVESKAGHERLPC